MVLTGVDGYRDFGNDVHNAAQSNGEWLSGRWSLSTARKAAAAPRPTIIATAKIEAMIL